MATLAELRAMTPATPTRPTRSLAVCLDQSAMAAINKLTAEANDLENQDAIEAPKRTGQKAVPSRLTEIEAEVEALYDKMRESQGTLGLRGFDEGAWLRWKDEHPPAPQGYAEITRPNGDTVKGEAIYDPTDLVYSGNGFVLGYFNIRAVIADLANWVETWEDEPLADGDWTGWLGARVAPADHREAALLVVQMHEERVLVRPKSPSAPSPTESAATD